MFYKNNSKDVSAISIGEPDNIRNVLLLLSVENKILDSIRFPLHIWDSKNKIFISSIEIVFDKEIVNKIQEVR